MTASIKARVLRCLLVLLGLAAGHAPAHAYSVFIPIDVMGTAMSGAIMDAARAGSEAVARSGRSLPDVKADAAASLDYTASPARTRANVASFAAKSRTVDPQGAAALEQLFASQDIMGLLDVELGKAGLQRTNLADAYAVWWTNAWLGTQGRNEDLPRAQLQAVKQQAAAALSATGQVDAMTDTDKQAFAEALLIQAMLISASVDAAKEQPAAMPPTKAAIAKGALATGVDLSTMTLTAKGFVMKR